MVQRACFNACLKENAAYSYTDKSLCLILYIIHSGRRLQHHFDSSKTSFTYLKSLAMELSRQVANEEECPVCYTSFMTTLFEDSDDTREAHVVACIESQLSSSASQHQDPLENDINGDASNSERSTQVLEHAAPHDVSSRPALSSASNEKVLSGQSAGATLKQQEDRMSCTQSLP